MKFDLDTAWRETTRLARDNAALLSAIAGIFVFLPYAALMLALPAIAPMPELPDNATLPMVMAAFEGFYAETWWAFVIVGIVVTIGMLAMTALLGRRERPTVGEAIAMGLKAVVPAWLALFLINMGINLIVLSIIGAASATGLAALAFVASVFALALALNLFTRLSLTLPVIAIEGEFNPLHALVRAWRMTAAHGRRLLIFYLLIALALLVVAVLAILVSGLILALLGAAAAQVGGALVLAAIIAAIMTLLAAVLAAVHRQLVRLAHGGGPSVPRAGGR